MRVGIMSMDLSSSLTAMDWLPRLRADGRHHHHHHHHPPAGHFSHHHHTGGMFPIPYPLDPRRIPIRPIGRKLPPSPIDLTARLDPIEAQTYRFHDAKPPYSYATLITYAINSSPKGRMTLNEIYTWICNNFPYYRDAGTGWKVRN